MTLSATCPETAHPHALFYAVRARHSRQPVKCARITQARRSRCRSAEPRLLYGMFRQAPLVLRAAGPSTGPLVKN